MTTRTHVLLVVLTLGSIGFIIRLIRQRVLKVKYSLLWLSIGGAMAVIAAVPGLLDWAAEQMGVYDPPNVFLMLGLGFLLLVVMHFSWELSRMENRIRALAEEIALLRGNEAVSEADSLSAGG